MKHKNEILQLRQQGKSYREIVKLLGCAPATVCYHCGKGQKSKTRNRENKRRITSHPYDRKVDNFLRKYPYKNIELSIKTNLDRRLYMKIKKFCRTSKNGEYMIPTFTIKDVINKFGENPICYLTGKRINIYEPGTYQFDHIKPRSRGGDNTLDNLGICTSRVNKSKVDMTREEYVELCKEVVEYDKIKSGS